MKYHFHMKSSLLRTVTALICLLNKKLFPSIEPLIGQKKEFSFNKTHEI